MAARNRTPKQKPAAAPARDNAARDTLVMATSKVDIEDACRALVIAGDKHTQPEDFLEEILGRVKFSSLPYDMLTLMLRRALLVMEQTVFNVEGESGGEFVKECEILWGVHAEIENVLNILYASSAAVHSRLGAKSTDAPITQ